MAMPGLFARPAAQVSRPAVGTGVEEMFVQPAGNSDDITYQPHLLRKGTVHFSLAKADVEVARQVCMVNPLTEAGVDWEVTVPPPLSMDKAGGDPAKGAGFGELPGFAMNSANYKQAEKDFSEWLYRNEREEIFACPSLKQWSRPGESEADFRSRLSHEAREARDVAVDKLRTAAVKKIGILENRLSTAEARLVREKAEANTSKLQVGVSVLGGILGSLFGRKSGMGSITRGTSAITKAGSAYKQHQDVSSADAKVEDVVEDITAAKAELEAEVARISESYDPAALALEPEVIKPTRSDVRVEQVALLWLPYDGHGERAW
jgi:hypothetical protein